MKRRIAYGAAVLLFGGSLAPVIPQAQTFDYAYQYRVADVKPAFVSSTSTNPTLPPTFPDDNGDGVVSVAAFDDGKGNVTYKQISETQYRAMGQRDGYAQNPTLTTFGSLMQLAVTTAHAAVAIDSKTSANAALGSTSLTYAFNNVGGDFIVVCANTEGGVTVSSMTYNAVTLTNDIGSATNPGSRIVNCKSLTSPATGSHNVVVNYSGATQGTSGAITFTGDAGTASGVQTEIGTLTNMSLTVTCTASGFVADALVSGNRTVTFGGSQTQWYNGNPSGLLGAGSTAAGASTVTMTETISSAAEGGHIAFCIDAAAAAAAASPLDSDGWWLVL